MTSTISVQDSTTAPDSSTLPAETVAFASRMFDAARAGDPDGSLLAAVEAGLPPNLTNHQGNTLLMLCTYSSPQEKTLALSRALLDLGADPNRLNDSGQSIIAGVVFKRIASQGRDELVQLLLERGADPRLGKPNAIETTLMFVKDKDEDGGLGKEGLLQQFGATEEDKKRMESEGVRVPIPGH
ncbi:ankyrin [Lentinula lateritia]|nr:ankyrin [Lentinula lateritia]